MTLERRAKYLVCTFDDKTVLLAHLGMSGRMVIENRGPQFAWDSSYLKGMHDAHEHIVFEIDTGTTIRFLIRVDLE